MSGAQAVELRGVTKRFGEHVAVDDVSLSVPVGSIFGFIGPNGSGKTTTLRLILRIYAPTGGSVWVLGNADGTSADDRVGYLPEERGLYKGVPIGKLLAYHARLKGLRHPEKEIRSLLHRFELSDWIDKPIEALSKGMGQKVQFAAAVVTRPELVILDEPFSGLDPVSMEVLEQAILELRRGGTTVLLSTHDMTMAERLCDFVAMIYRGRKVLDGTITAIRAQYGNDTVRLRTRGGDPSAVLEGLPGVMQCRDFGGYQELQLRREAKPREVLEKLVHAGAELELFEVTQPSLHDIFVRIARPEGSAREEVAHVTHA